MNAPQILDLDGSVLPVTSHDLRLDRRSWQEAVRFGCTRRVFCDFADSVQGKLGTGPLFLGSGDFHHLTLLALAQRATHNEQPFDVLVLDNHPDTMRYPFGVHCGSWVAHAAALPGVRHIHVAGITSSDLSAAHAVEMNLGPLWQRKVTFWSVGLGANWLHLLGLEGQSRAFASPEALAAALVPELRAAPQIYVSIDKDVFARSVVQTTWDQGVFELAHAEALLTACAGRIHGADVTGDASCHSYDSLFKRFLVSLDGQLSVAENELAAWRIEHQTLNRHLVSLLQKHWA